MIRLLFALFHFHLLCSISSWGSTHQTLLNELQVLHNKSLFKFIEGRDWNTSDSDIYETHWIRDVNGLNFVGSNPAWIRKWEPEHEFVSFPNADPKKPESSFGL